MYSRKHYHHVSLDEGSFFYHRILPRVNGLHSDFLCIVESGLLTSCYCVGRDIVFLVYVV